jgi:glycerol-3-phosphate dehydrogenase (NAD(P)+)
MTRAAVLGTGSWGTAFAQVLVDSGTDTVLWARREEIAEQINGRHENVQYLPGIALPATLSATTDAEQALAGVDIVVLAVPSQTLRENLALVADLIPQTSVLVSLMKGVELGTDKRSAGWRSCPVRTWPGRSPSGSRPPLSSPARTSGSPTAFRRPAMRATSGPIPTMTSSAASSAARSRT